MSDKPKRPFRQIHVSTALVGMILLSVIVGLSCRRHVSVYVIPGSHDGSAMMILYGYGWPFDFFQTDYNEDYIPEVQQSELTHFPTHDKLWLGGLIDFACAMGVLLAITLLLEWLIRRREARKP